MYRSCLNFFHRSQKVPWVRYVIPLLIIGVWTGLVEWAFPNIDIVNLAMTYLAANVIITVRYGQGPAIISTMLSVASFDFFFIPPYFAMTVKDTKYWVTFSVMIAVTILISRLTLQSRRSSEEALAAQLKAEREKLMSSLLSSVSHDLRTPLTSISGAASTLLEQESKISLEDRKHLLEMINDESIRLNRLVEKILQITKIESGNIHVRKEMHSLEEMIGSVLNRLDSLLEGRKITTEIPNDLSAPLDDLLIEQVFVNLLENAIRHTPLGSPIDIRVFQDSKQVWLEILDRGPGIPKQDQHHIFEKFYRSDRKEIWGSGLGLAICQGILKVHQGQIGVRDREGGGSVFYFSLPLQR
jgi:K+-sensing histidine kinase KdpD